MGLPALPIRPGSAPAIGPAPAGASPPAGARPPFTGGLPLGAVRTWAATFSGNRLFIEDEDELTLRTTE